MAAAAAGAFAWQSRTLPIDVLTVRPLTADGVPAWLPGALSEEIADAARPAMKTSADPMHSATLEGIVSRAGDRVRVVATLTRGDGHRYWTRTIERPMPDIARETAGVIAPSVRKHAPRHKPPVAAYEKFLQGRYSYLRGDFGHAVEAFRSATQADPDFARAFAWAGIAGERIAARGAARPNDVLPAARDAAERAATLAPDLAESHLALGIIRLQYDWDWDDARAELDRALQLSPGNPMALQWRVHWLVAMNRAPAASLDLPAEPRDSDSARQLLAQADTLRAQRYITPIEFALAANVAHDADSLFRWLDVAYEERSGQLPYLLRNPALPQSDPRLRELIRRLKLPTDQ